MEKQIKYVFFLLSCMMLVSIAQAQRPLPGQNQGFPPNQGQNREQQGNPDQERGDQTGRKKLIDDSTKMVYGPKTTLYFLEKDIKRNRMKKYEVDTLLDNFHYYEPNANSGWKFQDLGNVGSAAKPLFYQAPVMIGTTSGFHAYDLYYNSTDSMKYYDTKSPYTSMNAFYGGGNRNLLDIVFARNVNPRWNVGFNFHTIRARKTLNPNRRDDNLAEQNAYSMHTSYKSENDRYLLLASFSRMLHKVNEQGGIISPTIDENSLLFAYEDAKVWLRNSRASDLRQDIHLYQEYELVKGWQLYHVIDRRNQEVTFRTNLNSPDSAFFNRFNPERFNNVDSTFNNNQFLEWRNEVGFKGDLGPIYYNAFLKYRTGRMRSPFFVADNGFTEVSVGGALRGDITEQWRFEAEGEYLFPDAFRIKGLFVSPWLEASYTKALYRPTSFQQLARGNHHRWSNRFSNTGLDQIQGMLKIDGRYFTIRPNLTLNRINNYVFFNQEQQATQSNAEVFMVIPGIRSSVNLRKKLFWESEVYYTLLEGEGANNFRIPSWFINSRVYYESPMFNDNLYVQIGVDGRFRDDFFADNYNPAMQQFFLQDEFNVFAYPIVDFFINARINRTRILFRFNHLNINTLQQPGYFVTPYYTGLRRVFDIGISWPLFD
ncbi:MAG: putative porin [Mongoliitalea sp.]